MKRFLLLSLTALLISNFSFGQVPQSERDALVDLYNATNGSNWTNTTNWNTANPVSTWFGVSTQIINAVEHVTFISLGDNNLEPNLPSSIGNLSELIGFQIVNTVNQFGPGGTIPSTIGNLNKLQDFTVRAWNLSGTIPSEIGNLSQLTTLDLRESSFSGSLPASITNLTNLQILTINNNNFSGTIPNLTGIPLIFFRIQSNLFRFGDFENEFSTYQSNINSFTYSPQKVSVVDPNNFLVNIGDTVPLNSAPVSGASNQYQWYLNAQLITGANSPNLNLTNIQANQFGTYQCVVTSSLVPGLSILGGTFEVSQDPTSSPDYDTLIAFYNATNGDNWTNKTNWLDTSKPLSTWFGLTIVDNRVEEINLNSNNVSGNIPEEIGDLDQLKTFSVRLNSLFGELPTSFYNLSNLEYLDINSNSFSGEVPSSIENFNNLTYLDLGWNFYTGAIPSEISNLNNLQFIYFQNNNLEGVIPTSLLSSSSLQVLFLANNNLSGLVPDVSIIPTLFFLNISNNKFIFADIESNFNQLSTNLSTNFIYQPQQFIDEPRGIAGNIGETITLTSLTGLGTNLNIDWYDGETFQFLGSGETFDITINTDDDYENYIYFVTSSIVTGLGLQSQPITIGPDPSTHPDYDALIAMYNALDGPNWTNPWDISTPIETWDTTFRLQFDDVTNRVIHFEYSGSNLSGTIPADIGDLTELRQLWLFGNDITGEVPSEIWNLTNLVVLVIGSQESSSAYTPGTMTLSGGIPAEINNLQQLEWLNLNGVQLSLPLQPELFNLPNFIRLRLQDCGISGQLPIGFANISDVRVERNEFSGAIPPEILNSTGNLRLAVTGNYFNFSDLEPLVSAANIQFLELSPQRTLDQEQTIESAPGADIVLTINDTDINRSNNDIAMNNVYQWFKDESPIAGANANSYTITNAQVLDSGTYYCEITNTIVQDLIIRRADIDVLIDESLSLVDNDVSIIKIYPNPASTYLNIQLKNSISASAKIFDLNGRLLLNQSIDSEISVIDISDLQSSVYILKIKSNQGSASKRFIKQ